MAWTGVTCLALFINSIVWNGNTINRAPVWCDITSRLYVAIGIAIPAACLCIARRLYQIAVVRNVIITKAEIRRSIIIDLAIGLGLPMLGMSLQYISQGHRFDILEDVGCFPFNYNTPVGIVIVSVPPILIGCVSGIYAILGVMAFNKSRIQYNQLLSGTNLTNHRYIRLMCLCSFGTLCTIGFGSYALFLNTTTFKVYPWKGWADTHADFSRVGQIPAVVWRYNSTSEGTIELDRWLNVLNAFTFFLFFGFAEEARNNYSSAAQSFAKRVGITYTGSFATSFFNSSGSKSGGMMSEGGGATLPVFIRNSTIRKVDDLDSISDMSVSSQDMGDALNDEKEKPFPPDLSYDAMSLADVGGALADHKIDPYSRTPSLVESSTSSLSTPAIPPPALLRASHPWPDSNIEHSSVRYLDAQERPISIAVSQLTLENVSISRRTSDTPSEVPMHRNSMV